MSVLFIVFVFLFFLSIFNFISSSFQPVLVVVLAVVNLRY